MAPSEINPQIKAMIDKKLRVKCYISKSIETDIPGHGIKMGKNN